MQEKDIAVTMDVDRIFSNLEREKECNQAKTNLLLCRESS